MISFDQRKNLLIWSLAFLGLSLFYEKTNENFISFVFS